MLNKIITRIAQLLVVFLLCQAPLFAKENPQEYQFSDVTILVSSCDRYSFLWKPFFESLFKQWPSLQTSNRAMPILLIANTKSYDHPRIKTIQITNETSWSDNMLTALQQVKTKYVLVLLDDYWLSKPVEEKRLMQLLKILQNGNTAFIQTSFNDLNFHNGVAHENIPGVVYRKKFGHYKVSLQGGLWDKESLVYLIRPGESPWDFEIAGSIRSHGYPKAFLSLTHDEPIHYLNASHLGHITPEALDFVKAQNIRFEPGTFPRLGAFNWQISKRIWVGRWKKFVAFLKNPGLFYELEAS